MLHEGDDGGRLEQPLDIILASLAVLLFGEDVALLKVCIAQGGRGAAGEDGEEVGPGEIGRVAGGGIRLRGGRVGRG